jgi:hypothetical protein
MPGHVARYAASLACSARQCPVVVPTLHSSRDAALRRSKAVPESQPNLPQKRRPHASMHYAFFTHNKVNIYCQVALAQKISKTNRTIHSE